jgi:ferric-chelate reductase (NADPH)
MARTLLDQIVSGVRMRSATVTRVDVLSPRFRRIVLAGPALRGASWEPGDKLQLLTPSLRLRTYTPTRWDAERGETELLAFLHGEGPGAQWARAAAVGERVQLFGPRPSLALRRAPGGLVVGDETSVGLAWANGPGAGAVLEVADVAEVSQVLAAIGLTATLVARSDAGRADALTGAVTGALGAGRALVLSGRAQLAAELRARLKSSGALPRVVLTKAYWAPGKTGLD